MLCERPVELRRAAQRREFGRGAGRESRTPQGALVGRIGLVLDIIKTSNADDVIRWIYGMIHHDFKEEVLESSVVIIYQFDKMTPENGDMENARNHLVKLIKELTPLGPVVQFKL